MFSELQNLPADCVIISATKLRDSFSIVQFLIPEYKTPCHADRDSHGGGILSK